MRREPAQGKTPQGRIKLLMLGLLLTLLCQGLASSDARPTLRGSATVTRQAGTGWYPRQSSILRADTMTADYKLDAAEALYRQILQQDPRNAGAWNGLGKIARARTTSSNQNLRDKTGNLHDTAIQHFMTALRYQPNYVEAHVNLAGVYMDQGRMAEAADHLDRALNLASQDGNVLTRKGEWLVRQGEFNEAVPYLREALALDNANPSAHFYLGVAHLGRGQEDEAHYRFQMTTYLDPRNASAYHELGRLYEKQGNGAAAVESYQKALSLKPELTPARLKLADYFEKRGDWSAAIEQLKTVLDSTAGSWELTDRIGRLSSRNNQPEVAVKYYRQWMNAHPEDQRKASEGLSWAKTQLAGKKLRDDNMISRGEAQRYAEQALKYAPDNFEARLIDAKYDREIGEAIGRKVGSPSTLGMVDVALQMPVYRPHQAFEKGELLLSRYQFAAADQAFRTARLSSRSNKDQMIFGELFLTKGLPHLADEAFTQVLRQLPGNASARLGLAKSQEAKARSRELVAAARLMTRREQWVKAIEQTHESLRYDARNSEAYYLLGQLYEKQHDYAQAADHYYAYLALNPGAQDYRSVQRRIDSLKQKIARSRPL